MRFLRPINEEEGDDDIRSEAKAAIDEFMKSQSSLDAAYLSMKESTTKIESAIRSLRKNGDHAAAEALDNHFKNVRENLLFSVKDAMKYKINQSAQNCLQAVAPVGKSFSDIPTSLKGVVSVDEFNNLTSFLKAKMDRYSNVAHRSNYGISTSKTTDHTYWTRDGAESKVYNTMIKIRQALQDMTKDKLESVNKEMLSNGFFVSYVNKETIEFRKK